jgi:hypothetical protein
MGPWGARMSTSAKVNRRPGRPVGSRRFSRRAGVAQRARAALTLPESEHRANARRASRCEHRATRAAGFTVPDSEAA